MALVSGELSLEKDSLAMGWASLSKVKRQFSSPSTYGLPEA